MTSTTTHRGLPMTKSLFCAWVLLMSPWFIVSTMAETESEIQTARDWRAQQLNNIASSINQTPNEEQRLEYLAQQAWLRRWQPGDMPAAPASAPNESELVAEPLLSDLTRPPQISEENWQQLVMMQTTLHAIDTDEDRKQNLRQILPLAHEFESRLSRQLPKQLQEFPSPTAWCLAHTRYRLGRALAYRELPTVHEAWPIEDSQAYEKQLLSAYRSLTKLTGGSRTEFILLEDRMLRRAGEKGRALQLLEANKESIDPKWYLKKRRDLLQELGWDPPYQEAAEHFTRAGYVDEP